MTGMKWTRQEFEESITALDAVLHEETTATAAAQDACRLLNWQLQRHAAYNRSVLYLSHPSVDRMSPSLEHAAAFEKNARTIDPDAPLISNHHHSNDDDDSEDYTLWLQEDGTIQMDPDCCSYSTSQSHALDKTHNNINTTMTQWTFSIVYSDTWRVPILYFTVQWYDTGSPCTRTEVLQWLKSGGNPGEDDDDNGWDFVSQEEHPITGLPTFFLHPCQIEARMALLEGGLTKEEDGADDDDQGTTFLRHRSNGFILWAYMAMLFPVVGHSIPSTCFQRVKIALTTSRNGEPKEN
jgi:Autophagocytosis associated protein, active-site domain